MEKKYDEGGNITFDTEGQYIKFYINSKIYPLNVVSQAAYALMDRAAVVLSGNPDGHLVAEIRPIKTNHDLNLLIKEFNDELLNYSSFFFFSEKSYEFRNALLSSILQGPVQSKPETKTTQQETEDIDKIFEEWEKDSEDTFED